VCTLLSLGEHNRKEEAFAKTQCVVWASGGERSRQDLKKGETEVVACAKKGNKVERGGKDTKKKNEGVKGPVKGKKKKKKGGRTGVTTKQL